MESIQPLTSKPKLIQIGIMIAFIIISIVAEIFYRDPLFEYSLEFIEDWQNLVISSTIIFFKVISFLGSEYFIAIHIAWIYIIMPLTFSFTYTSGMITFYMFNLMKLWYGAERPFWYNFVIAKACDVGFGNPSGHALSSIFIYLVINKLIINCKHIKDFIIIKVISNAMFLLVIFFDYFEPYYSWLTYY